VSNILWATFCWIVIIKLSRALSEFYDSRDMGLNLSVRKLQWQKLTIKTGSYPSVQGLSTRGNLPPGNNFTYRGSTFNDVNCITSFFSTVLVSKQKTGDKFYVRKLARGKLEKKGWEPLLWFICGLWWLSAYDYDHQLNAVHGFISWSYIWSMHTIKRILALLLYWKDNFKLHKWVRFKAFIYNSA